MKFKNYITEAAISNAYWISRRGEVVEVTRNHIATVIENPKKFGYTYEEIKEIYDKHDESMGVEGKAREEIIRDLIKKGWIRIRKYKRKGYSVNISRMTKKVKDILYDWANKLLNKGIKGVVEKDKYTPVTILGFQDMSRKDVNMQDLANDVLYEDEEFDENNSLTILESPEDLYEPERLLDNL